MISRFMLKILSKSEKKKNNLKKSASFIQATVSQAVRDNYRDVMTDFRDLLKHIDRPKCEITFIKCQHCKTCLNTKVKSKKIKEICSYDFYNSKIYLKLDMLIH